ncbi:MAG: hypothetical protein ACO1SV_17400 [Fimbriimonas sp.]
MRQFRQALPVLSVAVLLAIVLGCGGGGGGARIFSEQQILAPSGGTYQFRGGQVSITVPANVLTANTPVTIQSPPSVAVPVDANVVEDTTYQFTALTFPSAVTVGLGYDPAELPSGVAESQLRVVRLTNGAWVNQSATLDAVNDRLTLSTTTLGVFAIRVIPSATTGSTATTSTATTSATATTATTSTTATTGSTVVAEAGLDGEGTPTVFVSWEPSAFGTFQRERWQVFRNDVAESPVLAATGAAEEVGDTPTERAVNWSDFDGQVGGDACVNRTPDNATAASVPGVVLGRPYQYSAQLIYSRAESELPAGGTSTARCYFASSRQSSSTATPIARPQPNTPADGSPITGSVTFSFESVSAGLFTAEYVVQVSASATFSDATTVARVESAASGTLSTSPVNLTTVSPGTTPLYWRVGARNAADSPGPRRDPLTGDRYVFGSARTLTR